MRCPVYVLLPAVALSCALLTGCDDQWTSDYYNTSTSAWASAHPVGPEGRGSAFAPPAVTHDYPEASSGPGTASLVTPDLQSNVVSFVELQLGQVGQLIQEGKLDRASNVLKGVELRRSSWSLATQEALASKIDAARKNLDAAEQKA